jgi:hypothetical protein
MTQFSTDFADSGYVAGSQPSDWTARFDAAISAAKADFDVEADTTGGSFGDQVLQVDYISSGNSALSWDDVGSNANVDLAVRIRWLSLGALQRSCGLIARGNEDSAGEDGYTVTVDLSGSTLKLYKLVNGTDTSIGSAIVAPSIVQDRWYWLRLQVSGTAIKVRIWSDAETEPATWNIETTDSSVSAAGWCGIYTRYVGDAEVDWFGAGTAGDAPPAIPAAEGDVRITQIAVELLKPFVPEELRGGSIIIAG